MPTKLFNKDFVLLWQGQFISRMGGNVYSIAMVLWLKEATGSATLVGLVMMLGSLPSLFLSGIGGTLADRASRKQLIVWSDVIRGLLVMSFAVVLVTIPTEQLTTTWLIAVTVLMASTTAFYVPAVAATVPEIVPPDKLVKANSLRQLTAQIALVAGQAAGGTLFRLVGAPILVVANALSFFVSALAACFVRIPHQRPAAAAGGAATSFGQDLIDGLRFAWREEGLKWLLIFSAVFTFFTVPIIVLMPFYVDDVLGAAPDWYGWLMATYAGGTALGAVLTSLAKADGALRARLMITFAILSSVAVGILGLVREIDVALGLALLLGAMTGFNGINITSITQARVDGAMRGRVQGLLATVTGSLAPIGMGLGGILYDMVDGNVALIFGGCGLIMALLSIVVANNTEFRAFISYTRPQPGSGESKGKDAVAEQPST